MDQEISTEQILNQILAIDLSSGIIWSELNYQVASWLERINDYDTTKWILYLSAIQEGEKIDLNKIQCKVGLPTILALFGGQAHPTYLLIGVSYIIM